MFVKRPKLTVGEKLYLPVILDGMSITLKHLVRTLLLLFVGRKEQRASLMNMTETGLVTMQYPEQKWPTPEGYRGAPVLVKDEEGREKCVSCQLCEFVCPPRAIRITPGKLAASSPDAHVEKAPQAFEIDMLRCIYCGLCAEVCPEEAIFLKKDLSVFTGKSRREMLRGKEGLYELGGVLPRPIQKWKGK
ncbi:MAG: NADH-quinone oxidoreductase subunit I [bacterium]